MLQRARQVYGVPPEIIVGIIGVETRWGRVMGKTRIIDALATLAFDYPRRADYFAGELETFLLMSRTEGDDPLELRGSFAGAMGYGQFMPSSFKSYAVDFNGDGHINLWIRSMPLAAWPITSRRTVGPKASRSRFRPTAAPGLENGFKTRYSVTALAEAGLSPQGSLGDNQKPACCGWTSAPATSIGTACRTSTPSPAITTVPITPWRYGSWAKR